jgi:hypothetical protein
MGRFSCGMGSDNSLLSSWEEAMFIVKVGWRLGECLTIGIFNPLISYYFDGVPFPSI